MEISNQPIDELSSLVGISDFYHDIWGNLHKTGIDTKKAILGAMGFNIHNPSNALDDFIKNQWIKVLPPVFVFKENTSEIKVRINIPQNLINSKFIWIIQMENGEIREGVFSTDSLLFLEEKSFEDTLIKAFHLSLDVRQIPFGYHILLVKSDDRLISDMSLICVPLRSYHPSSIEKGEKLWGPAVQVYALRSSRNMGIGDFSDLKRLMEIFSQMGASLVGIGPINALFPANPFHISPYSPSSRNFLNYIYIALDEMEFLSKSQKIKEILKNELNTKIERLKSTDYISYSDVANIKLYLLEKIWEEFKENELKKNSPYGMEFEEFISDNKKSYYFGLFNVLSEFYIKNKEIYSCTQWPDCHRDIHSQEIKEFAQLNEDRIKFYQFLEWICIRQLQDLGNKSMSLGLKIGLYGDLPVSVDKNGFDVWYQRDVFASGIGIGAPPDDFNLKGQNWGLIPFNPVKLRELRYEPFISILRYNMKYVGAIRIDHIMSLLRLFWIPEGMECKDGAYVNYNIDDLMGILALESRRNMTLIIGEDLGTVPDIVRDKMREWGIFSYKVMFFEKNRDNSFKSPHQYDEKSLLTVSTHDLPTLVGFWNFRDIEIRTLLDLFPNDEIRKTQIEMRENDRKALCYLLLVNGLVTENQAIEILTKKKIDLNFLKLIYLCLARSKSQILMIQLEDIFLESEQMNLPGTVRNYPNWSRKYTKDIEDLKDNDFRELFFEINQIRK